MRPHRREVRRQRPPCHHFAGRLEIVQAGITTHLAFTASFVLFEIGFMTDPSQSPELSIDVAGGTLHGILLEPTDKASNAIALIISGSGPTDRNNNSPGLRNDALRLLAEDLLAHGISSLRYDKRGVGASAAAVGREQDIVIETFVEDAGRWLEFLATKPNLGRAFIVGHSEGALIGALASQGAKVAGFVSLAGLGTPPTNALRQQLRESPLTPELQTEAIAILDTIADGQDVADVRPELAPLFRASVQPYLRSWFRYDPAAEVAKLAIPVLVVHGTTDIQVDVDQARQLAKANPEAQLRIIDGMNHILKPAPSSRTENVATYNDPNLPIDAELVESITSFIENAGR